jgi:hypothetical protein
MINGYPKSFFQANKNIFYIQVYAITSLLNMFHDIIKIEIDKDLKLKDKIFAYMNQYFELVSASSNISFLKIAIILFLLFLICIRYLSTPYMIIKWLWQFMKPFFNI